MAFNRQTIPFHLLKIKDKFKMDNKIYVKISDETAQVDGGTKTEFLWPTQSVYLMKSMDLDEFRKKYPEAEYRY